MSNYKLLTCLLLPIMFACNPKEEQQTKEDEATEHHEDHGANEYMHQSSFDALKERFEGAARDEYQEPEKVMDWLDIQSGSTMMDIGAGTGYFSFRLAEAGAKVIAADVDSLFQNYIKHKRDSLNIDSESLELRLLPYDSPMLNPSEADMVLIVNTWHHIENRPDYGSKIKEGLKEDGELVIIDFFKEELPVGPPPNHKLTMDEVIQELKAAGFSNITTNDTLLRYQYCIRAKR